MTVFQILGLSEPYGADVLLVAFIVVVLTRLLRKTALYSYFDGAVFGALPLVLGVAFYALYYLVLHGYSCVETDLPYVIERGFSVACVGYIESAFFTAQTVEDSPLTFRGQIVREVLFSEERVDDEGCEIIAKAVSSPPKEGDGEEVKRILLTYGLGEAEAKKYATVILETLLTASSN